MNNPIPETLTEYYEGFQLSPAQLQELQGLQRRPKPIRPLKHTNRLVWLAAAVLLGFFGGIWFKDWYGRQIFLKAVVAEVAENHRKGERFELETDSLMLVRNHLDRLAFRLVAWEQPHMAELELTGARYCSLQGVLAAQLNYRTPGSSKRATLYQVPLPEPLTALSAEPLQFWEKGILVRLWQEHDVLLVLAQDPE